MGTSEISKSKRIIPLPPDLLISDHFSHINLAQSRNLSVLFNHMVPLITFTTTTYFTSISLLSAPILIAYVQGKP